MTEAPRMTRPPLVVVALLLGGLALPSSLARADRISLRGGGHLKGKLIPDKAHPNQFLFLGEIGKTPMVFPKDQILQVTPEKSPLDEYVVLREQERPTAEAEYNLGVWCEEHKLRDLAQFHFDATVKRDSTFGPAHQKLGHVLREGRWLNADEVKEAQGLVKYKGRWVTTEEKERKDALAATAAEGASWVRRLKLLRDAYLNGPEERSQEAERRLLAVEEVIAVGPVLRVMGEDPIPALRVLAARMLGGIPGPEAASGLVGRLLVEIDENVLQSTMKEVARRDASEIVPLLAKALRSTSHEIVDRAAWGLSNLNAVSVVPRLVPALITIEYEIVMVGGSSGGVGTSFGNAAPSSGYSGSGPMVSSPAVGPGAVAFGTTSIPYGAANHSGISVGTGTRGPTPRLVPVAYRNGEVHAALVRMTGRDFGYDIPTWKRWVTTSFKVDTGPTRRVPQP